VASTYPSSAEFRPVLRPFNSSVPQERTPHTYTLSESESESESESDLTTDGQPASLSWNKAPVWGLRLDLYYLCDSYGLVLVGRRL
jgi:hypothetical protein